MVDHKKHNPNQSEVNTRDRRQARENACDQDVIGFGFATDWLSGWPEYFKPISKTTMTRNENQPTRLARPQIQVVNIKQRTRMY